MAFIIVEERSYGLTRTSTKRYDKVNDAISDLNNEANLRVIHEDWLNVLNSEEVELTNKPSMFRNDK